MYERLQGYEINYDDNINNFILQFIEDENIKSM